MSARRTGFPRHDALRTIEIGEVQSMVARDPTSARRPQAILARDRSGATAADVARERRRLRLAALLES